MIKERILQVKLNDSLSKFKDRIAIEYASREISYLELDQQSNFIANWIVKKNIGKGSFVGILVKDKVKIISAMIGILKAGCVFIPLDTTYPEDRLKLMIAATDTNFIFCDKTNYSKFNTNGFEENPGVEFILIDNLFLYGDKSWFTDRPEIRYDQEDKIYIYYTSGSTGTPRALLGKNKSLSHFIDWEIDTFCIDETFRFSQFVNPVFDAYLRDVFAPLCSGGTICIPDREDILLDSIELINWIEQNKINLIHCVPSLVRILTSSGLPGNYFHKLRYILLSGEKIEPADLVDWYRIFPESIQLVNLWGTSETTLAKTCYFITKSDVIREKIPVGKPIKGARVFVLNKNMNVCDKLETGELYIRTPFRTFGYYNDPELNRQKFIPNPLTNNPDDLLHKTGDLGRLLADGNIEFLGRIDRQAKIRGIRVELGEIESILMQHPSVKEAVVILKEMENKNEIVCAYIVESNKNKADVEQLIPKLKSFLSRKLPDFMIPSKIIKIAEIPRKSNKKVDYKGLPDPDEQQSDFDPPKNQIEERLVTLWSDILGIEIMGVKNHFYELGGNSLSIMRLINNIHKEFGVRIPLEVIFNNPTIEKQAEIIMKAAGEKYVPIKNAEEKEYYPLSSVQTRLYILQQIEPVSVIYNIPQIIELNIPLDRDNVQEIFNVLIKRHESLRTSFEKMNGEVVQRIHDEVRLAIEYFNVETEVEEQKAAREANKIIKNFPRPFDLSKAPLIRVGLLKLGKKEHLLIIDIHHIVVDAISMKILEREFRTLYNGEELAPLSLQYKDFSEFQNSESHQEAIKTQEKYWLKKFISGIPELNLPIDFPRPKKQDFAGKAINFKIDGLQIKKLRNLALREDVTLYMVLVAVFYAFLAKVSGQEDIVIGTGVEGRRHADFQKIIGMFVNTVVLRNYPKKEKTFREFLKEVKNSILEAFENEEYQFADLVEKIVKERDISRNPIFDVIFSYHDSSEVKRDLLESTSQQSKKTHIYEEPLSKFDLMLTAINKRDELLFSFRYRTKLFREETIKRYIRNIKEVLSLILENEDVKLNDIRISSDLIVIESYIPQTDFSFEINNVG